MDWVAIVTSIIAALGGITGITGVVLVLSQRRKIRADAAEVITDSALGLVGPYREELDRVRAETAEARAEAQEARQEARRAREAMSRARDEAQQLAETIRSWRMMIMRPGVTVEDLRAMVGDPGVNGTFPGGFH